jgi:hypothetical protein
MFSLLGKEARGRQEGGRRQARMRLFGYGCTAPGRLNSVVGSGIDQAHLSSYCLLGH